GFRMRAVVVERFMEPAALRVGEAARPEPGAGELSIVVRAAGCNFSDLLMLKGEYQVKPPFPFVPGSEVAGVVAGIGAGVAGFAVGDRVLARCGTGGFAEEVVAPAVATVKLPDVVSFEAGAALSTVYPTSYAALVWRAGLAPGETVLVHAAAGGVGLAAVQIARALGARVLATAGGRAKCEIARKAGAQLVVDYREGDFVEKILEATDGRGADVIYDSVGGETTDRSLKCIAWNGRLLVIGFASGEIPSVKLNRVLLKNISIIGLHWSAYPEREPARIADCFEGLFALAARGGIEPLLSARFPLERAGEALVALGARETVGKVVLVP
ncbi:NADPH:quinone oxidoreductase family protein, partial [Myxococcota bacterium]|nr:NADPH:quinone oxidoreductase family protein [Myxococcota bacterium]